MHVLIRCPDCHALIHALFHVLFRMPCFETGHANQDIKQDMETIQIRSSCPVPCPVSHALFMSCFNQGMAQSGHVLIMP